MWIYRFTIVAVICITLKGTYSLELEEFLSSLSSKKNDIDSGEVQEATEVDQEELLQLVKRSGLMAQSQQASKGTSEPISNQKLLQMIQELQSTAKQQNIVAYSPVYTQGSTQRSTRAIDSSQPTTLNANSMPYSYQNPTGASSTSQAQQNYLSQQRYPPKYIDSSTFAAAQIPSSQSSYTKDANLVYNSQQERNSNGGKSLEKDDRQGHYPYESYSGHDSGYGHARNPVYAHESSYAQHEPVHQNKLSLPIPQVAIKFDPLRLLRLLLSGLPRPLFNLNGKIFLGLELGKGAGLSVGGGGHPGGSKNLITIG